MDPVDVFLSYHSGERPEALALAEALRSRGLAPWLDVWKLVPGEPWQRAVEAAIAAAPAAAVLVGGQGLGPWQERESCAALEEFVRRGARLIPVLLPSAPAEPELPIFLRGFTWVDLRGGICEAGLASLEWGIRGRTAGAVQPAGVRCHLPFSSLGELFVGRGGLFAELEAELGEPGSGAQPQVLCGLGGIGKTRAAVEYAWRCGGRYHSIFLVGAVTPDSLRGGLAELADSRRLDLRLGAAGEDERIAAVLGWLERHPGWLLICDSVDTVEAQQELRQLLPLSGGHLLLTSRLATWPAEFRRRQLEILDRRDSVALLLAATGAQASDDSALAGQLAEQLGDLPLALEQAAAYIGARGAGFASYLEDWRTDRESILGWYDAGATHYPLAVARTWSRSVARLSFLPRTLLRLLAHYGAEPLPVAMLTAGHLVIWQAGGLLLREGFAGAAGGPELFGGRPDVLGALAELARYSLVVRQGATVSVHRMVQEVERGSIPAALRPEWAARALRLITDFAPRPPDDVRTWPVWDELRPHAERAIELALRQGVGRPSAVLMSELGILLAAKGLPGQAEPLLRRALLIDEAAYGPRDQRIAVDLNNLAQALQAKGGNEEAELLMRRALQIDEDNYGPDHCNVSRHLANLAALLKATGRLAEAEPLMRRALWIEENSCRPRSSKVALRLNNLAMLLEATERAAEAEPLARRALQISEEEFGPHHPKVASRLVNLAGLLQGRKAFDEAEPLLRRALSIDRQSFGAGHASVARDLASLASLAGSRGQLAEAIGLCRQALEICTVSLGYAHAKTRCLERSLAELEAEAAPAQGLGKTSTGWRQVMPPFFSENQAVFS
jgi:tetratricopeptide (TPR) repeat protein